MFRKNPSYSTASNAREWVLQALTAAGESGIEKKALYRALKNSGLMQREAQGKVFEFGRTMVQLLHKGEASKVELPNGKVVWYTTDALEVIKHKLPPGSKLGKDIIDEPSVKEEERWVEYLPLPKQWGPFTRYRLYYSTDGANWTPVRISDQKLVIQEVSGPIPDDQLDMGQICVFAHMLKITTQDGEEETREVNSFILIG